MDSIEAARSLGDLLQDLPGFLFVGLGKDCLFVYVLRRVRIEKNSVPEEHGGYRVKVVRSARPVPATE